MNGQLTKGGRTMPVSTMLRSSLLRGTLAVSLALPLLGAGTLRAPGVMAATAAVAPTTAVIAAAPSLVHAPAAALPTSVCPPDGDGVPTCELWAKAGTTNLTATVTGVPIWSFVASAAGNVTVPVGPTLVVTESSSPMSILLHNQVPTESVSLSLPQMDNFAEDTTGAASGSDAKYTFTPKRPGTFIYEAGGTADGARQAAMGLVGALVVLPDPSGTAYGPGTEYTNEQVLVISDVDPGLNNNPGSYDMRNFQPHFRLFNGVAYPATTPIPVDAGGTTLLRLVNGGIVQHSIGVLGTTQTVIAESARKLKIPYGVAAENVTAGDTLDMLVKIPAAEGLKYAVYDSSMRLDNDGALGTGNVVNFGGGLTFLQASGAPPVNNTAPVVQSVTITPPTRVRNTNLPFSAAITDDTSVASAEFVIDDANAPAPQHIALTTVAGGAFNSPSVTVTGTVSVAGLSTGTHQLLVRGNDGTGWGAFQSTPFKVDTAAPTIAGITPASAAVNGTADLAFSGSASDVGGGQVTSVQWALDGGGAQAAALPAGSASTVAFNGLIPAATVAGLTDGNHSITAIGTDDLGNVGLFSSAVPYPFLVDKTPPSSGPVVVTPSPNNGTQGVAYDATSIEVRAPYNDPGASPSGVVSGEGFIGNAGAPGTGFLMVVNAPTSTIVATVPLSQLVGLPEGPTTISVRAKDKAGNWGAVSTGTLVMNRAVTVTGLTLTPSPATTVTTVALAGTANAGAGQTIAQAEYFIGADPGAGLGTAMTVGPPGQTVPISANIALGSRTVGSYVVSVRARNSAGTWGGVSTITLNLASLFADGFEGAGFPSPWQSRTQQNSGTATRDATAAMTGSFGLKAQVTSNTGNTTSSRAYVTTPTTAPVATYHVKFQVNASGMSNMANTRWLTIYQARGGNTERFRVELQKDASGARVRLVVSANNGNAAANTSTPVTLAPGVTVQVDWTSAASATVTLKAGANTATLTGRNTSGRTITNGRLGMTLTPAGSGTYGGGVVNFDAYNSAFYAF